MFDHSSVTFSTPSIKFRKHSSKPYSNGKAHADGDCMILVSLMVIMLEIFAVTVISSIICKDIPSENLMCCLRSIYGVLCRNIYISIHPHPYSYICLQTWVPIAYTITFWQPITELHQTKTYTIKKYADNIGLRVFKYMILNQIWNCLLRTLKELFLLYLMFDLIAKLGMVTLH